MDIFILAKNMQDYEFAVMETIPGMEKYHKIKFKKRGNTYVGGKYRILPGLTELAYKGMQNYQVVKFGKFYENSEFEAIDAEIKMEMARRDVMRSKKRP